MDTDVISKLTDKKDLSDLNHIQGCLHGKGAYLKWILEKNNVEDACLIRRADGTYWAGNILEILLLVFPKAEFGLVDWINLHSDFYMACNLPIAIVEESCIPEAKKAELLASAVSLSELLSARRPS